jgi:cytosine/adenosine deaminase-related metal-dependent hydrolase
MTLGHSAGGLPPDDCVETDEQVLADSVRVIERYHDASPLAMRRIDLAPCAPFNITPALLDRTRDLAAERGVLLHTHIAETLDEERYCLERFGVRPLEYLRQHNWLGPNVYLAHCVHLNQEEVRLLAETSTAVAHCPSSNMRLGSGIAPIRRMLDAGVKVGLAVDGSSSNDAGNLMGDARQALLLQRVAYGAQGMSVAEAFRIATVGGARVLNRPQLGRIEPGYAADLVVFDANDISLAGAVAQDPLGALILCHPPRPKHVFVAGHAVVQEGRLARVDQAQLAAHFNAMVRKVFTND